MSREAGRVVLLKKTIMNTKKIQNTRVKKLFPFPELNDGKRGRVMTKHYTNMAFILPPDRFSLLSFLVYQTKADNTLEYSVKLLKTYINAILAGTETYDIPTHLTVYPPKVRDNFQWLIENGLLLPTSEPKQFMINPCLTYSKLYVRAEFYKEWTNDYEVAQKDFNQWNEKITHSVLTEFCDDYKHHVNKNMQRRKQSL